MKLVSFIGFYLILFILQMTQPLFSMEKTLNWQFVNPKTNDTVSLGEKGSVQEALINAGFLPDPLKEMNEKAFDWLEEYTWELTTQFSLSKDDLSNQFIDLELPSVDTYAKVYLNGILILSCENAFLPYRININQWAKKGENELKVIFTPPVLYHKDNYQKAKYKLPAPNDTHKTAIAPYTRKPQYQFGWDWSMRMNTMGFNKPVKIVGYQQNKILETSVQTISIQDGKAQISLAVKLAVNSNNILWNSELYGNILFQKDGEWLRAIVDINNPKLWWPKNHGEQFLYEDKWTFRENEKEIASKKQVFGIRTAKLVQEKNALGTSYEIVVNGRKIFCKGGNYIPQEIFPAKVTDESIQNLIQHVDEANLNMIRVWGGGYYPDDVFYETCDKLGIMVWQDFMFACAMYPGTDDFIQNVTKEFDYQIPRMTSHPSVVLLNGNNEVDVAWKNWGFQVQYGLFGKSAKEIEFAYFLLFKQVIPNRINVAKSTVPYIHTSPLSNWGKAEFFNHGSQHYWGVWHGKDPIEDFGNKIGRFNSEYGFQSFPEYSTLSAVIDKSGWNLESEVMKLRQKSYVGNGMIKKHADLLYGQTADFEKFIYFSQLTQAKAVSLAIAGHRNDWPRCAGTIYWQINDCWPAPTWSSMDYYGNWKALHYEVKKDFENIAVVAVEKILNKKEFYLVSDWTTEYKTNVSFDFYDLEGNWTEQHTLLVDVKPQTSVALPVFKLMQKALSEYIVVVKWKNESGTELQRTFYNATSLPKEQNAIYSTQIEGNKITITTDKPLINCWIYSENKPFHLDRNFETLLPGTHTFELKNGKGVLAEEIQLNFLSF